MGAFDDLIPGAPAGPFDDLVPKRGAIEEIATAAKRGLYEGVKGAGAVLQAPAEMARAEPGPISRFGQKMEAYGKEQAESPELKAQPEAHGGVTNFLSEAAAAPGQALPLLASTIPAASAGAAIGSAVAPGPGTVAGAVGGAVASGLAGGSTVALQTYHEKYHEALEKGLADDKARDYAAKSAALQGSLMGAVSAVPFAGPAVRTAVGAAGKTAGEAAADVAGKRFLPELGKSAAELAVVNTGLGVAGAAGQSTLDTGAGLETPGPLESAKAAFLPSLAGAVGFLPLGAYGAFRTAAESGKVRRALADPATPTAERLRAALAVHAAVDHVDPAAAAEWDRSAAESIHAGDPVALDGSYARREAAPSPAPGEVIPQAPIPEEPIPQAPVSTVDPSRGPLSMAAAISEQGTLPAFPFSSEEAAHRSTEGREAPEGWKFDVERHPSVVNRWAVTMRELAKEEKDARPLEGGAGSADRVAGGEASPGADHGGGAVAAEVPGAKGAEEAPHPDALAHEAATSPLNPRREPTDKEKAAGNYKMGHLEDLANLPHINVENPAGSIRRSREGVEPAWESLMHDHYGYFRGTQAADSTAKRKQGVDVFVKAGTPRDWKGEPFVVDQVNPTTGKFDEHKVIVGADDIKDAREIYRRNYAAGWKGAKTIRPTTIEALKAWLKHGDKSRPFAEHLKGDAHAAHEGVKPEGGVGQREGTDAGVQVRGKDRSESPGLVEKGAEAGGGDRLENREALDQVTTSARAVREGKDDALAKRLENPDIRREFTAMKEETGWFQRGGRLVRTDGFEGEVTGRTQWIPNASWWPDRPKGLKEHEVRVAVDKALAGEPLKKAEARTVAYMLDMAEARMRAQGWEATAEELKSEGLAESDAFDVALAARAADLNPDAFERLAVQFSHDDAAFMRGVKDILDEHDQNAETRSRGPESGRQAEEQAPAAQEEVAARRRAATLEDVTNAARTGDVEAMDRAHEAARRAGVPQKEVMSAIEATRVKPLTVTAQLFVERAGQRFPVASLEDASRKWEQFLDSTGAGASEIGEGARVVDQNGKEVGRISYNGKVWPPGEWSPDMQPLVGKKFKSSTPALAAEEAKKVMADLEERFGSDEALGVSIAEDDQSQFPDGSSAVNCTACARQVWQQLPARTEVWGFADVDNPSARLVTDDSEPGHDFAIVDHRFLVDPWIKLVSGRFDRAVFDLENPADSKLVEEWYGPPGKWKRMEHAAPALELKGETESEIKAREAQEKAAADGKAKIANAPSEKDFTLTGSDRQVDEAEARGQKPMFSRRDEAAPVYYSDLARKLEALPQKAGDAAQWRGVIDNLKGVKADEIEWSGVKDWLAMQAGKISKGDVQAYLRDNGVKVEEKLLGEGETGSAKQATSEMDRIKVELDSLGYDFTADDFQNLALEVVERRTGQVYGAQDHGERNEPAVKGFDDLPENVQGLLERWDAAAGYGRDDIGNHLPESTKFSSYTLPGGENYRELLLTLPSDAKRKAQAEFVQLQKELGQETDHNKLDAITDRMRKLQETQTEFRSSHFDQPNILAHVRFDERTDADGKRVLFIEEIQSDWAQKGKREGFNDRAKFDALTAEWKRLTDERRALSSQERERAAELTKRIDAVWEERKTADGKIGAPPRAPFVGKTEAWVALAVKRMIRYAAENGFDRVAYTTGAQQADRYDLSKHIDSLQYVPAAQNLRARKDGGLIFDRTVAPEDLADHIGKDAAKKLLESPLKSIAAGRFQNIDKGMGHELRGLDLKVGGEGMRSFYDKIVPNVVNDVLKKLGGGRVADVGLNVRGDQWPYPIRIAHNGKDYWLAGKDPRSDSAAEERLSKNFESFEAADDARKKFYDGFAAQPGFDITPAMRETVLGGVPMFKQGEASGERGAVDVRAVAERLGVQAKFADTEADLPEHLRGQIERESATGKVRGVFDPRTGEVWLVGANIHSEGEAAFVALHESAHRGLVKLFGEDLRPVLEQIFRSNESVQEKARALMLKYQYDQARATEEVLADMALRGQARALKGWESFVAFLREWLVKRGFNLKFSDDMAEYVAGAAAHAGKEEPLAGALEEAKFSQAGEPKSPAFRKWFDAKASTLVDHATSEPRVMYHGTNKDIAEFKGRGANWFSPDPRMASAYTGGGRRSRVDGSRKGGNVVPVYVRGNIVDLSKLDYQDRVTGEHLARTLGVKDVDAFKEEVRAANEAEGRKDPYFASAPFGQALFDEWGHLHYVAKGFEHLAKRHDDDLYAWFDDKNFNAALSRRGIDGVMFKHGFTDFGYDERGRILKASAPSESGVAVGVFDPADIKSAVGNRGTFDASSTDIRLSLAEAPAALFGVAAKLREGLSDERRQQEIARGGFRAALATLERNIGTTDAALDKARTAVDAIAPAERWKAMYEYQTGGAKAVGDEKLRPIFQAWKENVDERARKIQDWDEGYLKEVLPNYFSQMWKDPAKALEWYQRMMGKGPLEGGKSFLKKRAYATYREGMSWKVFDDQGGARYFQTERDARAAAGVNDLVKPPLEPVSQNFIDIAQLSLQQMDKFIAMHEFRQWLKEEKGWVKIVRRGETPPAGYAKVDDPAFRSIAVFAVTDPETGKIGAAAIHNDYMVPALIARDLNNYLDKGLYRFGLWRNFRYAENLMLSARLGFSAFHAGFTTMDTLVSHTDVGARYLLQGDVAKALHTWGKAITSPLSAPLEGRKLLKQFYGQAAADLNTRAILEFLTEGGARGRMNATDFNNSWASLRRAWSDGNIKETAWHALPALMEGVMRPIMHHLVPWQKMTARVLLAKFELDRVAGALGKEKGDYARIVNALGEDAKRQIAYRVVQQVDDRLGQVAYDNLFWNRFAKDIAQASIQSVGWNVGTANVILGGMKDVGKVFKPEALVGPLDRAGKVSADLGRVTGRLSYLISLNLTVGMMGAALNYLLTGEEAKDLRDYFFPRTGRKNPDGSDERISMPSYIKDEYALSQHPVTTVQHKLHPFFSMVTELLKNEDFYGTQIVNKDDPWTKMAAQAMAYFGKSIQPYAVQNLQQNRSKGETGPMSAAPFIGITPAPASVSRTPFEAYVAERNASAFHHTQTPEGAEKMQARRDAIAALKAGRTPELAVFTPAERMSIFTAARTPIQEQRFNRLSIQEKLSAWDRATPAERELFHLKAALAKDFMRHQATMEPDVRAKAMEILRGG